MRLQYEDRMAFVILSMNAPWIRDMEESEQNVSKVFRWIVAIGAAGIIALIVFVIFS